MAVLRLIRGPNLLIAAAGVLAGGWIALGRIALPKELVFAALSGMAIGAVGNTWNDMRDVAADRVNRPGTRPLAAGQISRGVAHLIVFRGSLLGIAPAGLVSRTPAGARDRRGRRLTVRSHKPAAAARRGIWLLLFLDCARRADGRRPRGDLAVPGPHRSGEHALERRDGRRACGARRGKGHMNLWQGILLGLVQGLTEFLPVSSDGHLAVIGHVAGVHTPGVFVEVALHVATLGSILVVYGGRFWRLAVDVLRRQPDALRYAGLLIIGMIPAGLVGIFLEDLIA